VKKIFQANRHQNQAGVAILISYKIVFKLKLFRRDKEVYFILIKGTIFQEETSVNIYVPNAGVPNFIKETLMNLKTQTDPNTMIVGLLSNPFSQIDRSSNKETLELNIL
jgi:hypothetical protein